MGALAIVAHEMGHAMQDEEDYGPMRVRSALVKPVNVGTQLGTVLFMIGFFLSYLATGLSEIGRYISWVGIFGFCLAALFALVTLPVELDASRRGLKLLGDSGLVAEENMGVARDVLPRRRADLRRRPGAGPGPGDVLCLPAERPPPETVESRVTQRHTEEAQRVHREGKRKASPRRVCSLLFPPSLCVPLRSRVLPALSPSSSVSLCGSV